MTTLIFRLFIILVAVFSIFVIGTDVHVETRTFCAYNRLFVEFEERGHIWGTMMLDDNGLPIRCNDTTTNSISNKKQQGRLQSI